MQHNKYMYSPRDLSTLVDSFICFVLLFLEGASFIADPAVCHEVLAQV